MKYPKEYLDEIKNRLKVSTIVSKSSSFYEVPVNYYGRTYKEGKKIRPHNAINVLLTIIFKRIFP